MKKNLLKALSLLAIISVLAAACSGSGTDSASTAKNKEASGEKSSADNSESVFTYIVSGDTGNSFNPLTADDDRDRKSVV